MKFRKGPDILSTKRKAQVRAKNLKEKGWLKNYRIKKEGSKYRVYYKK